MIHNWHYLCVKLNCFIEANLFVMMWKLMFPFRGCLNNSPCSQSPDMKPQGTVVWCYIPKRVVSERDEWMYFVFFCDREEEGDVRSDAEESTFLKRCSPSATICSLRITSRRRESALLAQSSSSRRRFVVRYCVETKLACKLVTRLYISLKSLIDAAARWCYWLYLLRVLV